MFISQDSKNIQDRKPIKENVKNSKTSLDNGNKNHNDNRRSSSIEPSLKKRNEDFVKKNTDDLHEKVANEKEIPKCYSKIKYVTSSSESESSESEESQERTPEQKPKSAKSRSSSRSTSKYDL